MTLVAAATRFDHRLVAELDEPVARFFRHALRPGTPVGGGVRLTMEGHIRLGAWLPFTAVQETRARSFSWEARVGAGPLTFLRAVDAYAGGSGSMDVRLFGRMRAPHAGGLDTARSAAGRAALEAVTFAPATVLPGPGIVWHAEEPDHLVAALDLGIEHVDVHVRIDRHGAVLNTWAQRWHGAKAGYVPCGALVASRRHFGDYVIPGRCTVGWGFGTPAWRPFLRCEILELEPLG